MAIALHGRPRPAILDTSEKDVKFLVSVGGQSALVRETGISRGALANYIAGTTSPQVETVKLISKVSGVDLAWLLTGGGGEDEQKTYAVPGLGENQTHDGHVSIPRYDIQASAGHGAFADGQEVADHLTVSRQWLNHYVSSAVHVVVIEARGDSMEPTVRHGDLLMVEMGVDRENVAGGGVFVIAVAGMIMVKRLRMGVPHGHRKTTTLA